jgi:hypothetical protein
MFVSVVHIKFVMNKKQLFRYFYDKNDIVGWIQSLKKYNISKQIHLRCLRTMTGIHTLEWLDYFYLQEKNISPIDLYDWRYKWGYTTKCTPEVLLWCIKHLTENSYTLFRILIGNIHDENSPLTQYVMEKNILINVLKKYPVEYNWDFYLSYLISHGKMGILEYLRPVLNQDIINITVDHIVQHISNIVMDEIIYGIDTLELLLINNFLHPKRHYTQIYTIIWYFDNLIDLPQNTQQHKQILKCIMTLNKFINF